MKTKIFGIELSEIDIAWFILNAIVVLYFVFKQFSGRLPAFLWVFTIYIGEVCLVPITLPLFITLSLILLLVYGFRREKEFELKKFWVEILRTKKAVLLLIPVALFIYACLTLPNTKACPTDQSPCGKDIYSQSMACCCPQSNLGMCTQLNCLCASLNRFGILGLGLFVSGWLLYLLGNRFAEKQAFNLFGAIVHFRRFFVMSGFLLGLAGLLLFFISTSAELLLGILFQS